MYKVLFAGLFLVLGQVTVFGQNAWNLSAESEGIKVYTAPVPDSKIKAIKVECEIQATESQLVAVLMDINTSAEWVYHLKSAAIIKQVSPSELYYYCEVSLPWPAANRDFVAHLTVTQDPRTKVVIIDGPAVPGMMPGKKGIVRINNSTGRWVLTPEGSDKVKIEYTLHVDPAGKLPAWLVNTFATDSPLQIFKSLRVQIQKPQYKNAVLAFVQSKPFAVSNKF
jgi:hypothetical protein